MFSNSIRDHLLKTKKKKAVILLKRKTGIGIFNFSAVNAEIITNLNPFETLVLSACKLLKKITRIEVSALTGFSIDFANEILKELLITRHIDLVEFNRESLKENLKKIDQDLGTHWKTAQFDRIKSRKKIAQYQITKLGEKALLKNERKYFGTTELNLLVLTAPFLIFFDKLNLKQVHLDAIEPNPELIDKILYLVGEETKKISHKNTYKKLSPENFTNANYIDSIDIWVPIEEKIKKSEK